MELLFEIVMIVFLDAAMLFLICTVFKADETKRKSYRFLSGTLAMGFLCGVVAQIIFGRNVAMMILMYLGFILSYSSFVFTFPERGQLDESC